MIITGILQVRNEVISGHLARFLEWNLPILDHLVAYDDCSTDQTVSESSNLSQYSAARRCKTILEISLTTDRVSE